MVRFSNLLSCFEAKRAIRQWHYGGGAEAWPSGVTKMTLLRTFVQGRTEFGQSDAEN
jgi:hypothetical protein